jgi:hypothetical protein
MNIGGDRFGMQFTIVVLTDITDADLVANIDNSIYIRETLLFLLSYHSSQVIFGDADLSVLKEQLKNIKKQIKRLKNIQRYRKVTNKNKFLKYIL